MVPSGVWHGGLELRWKAHQRRGKKIGQRNWPWDVIHGMRRPLMTVFVHWIRHMALKTSKGKHLHEFGQRAPSASFIKGCIGRVTSCLPSFEGAIPR